MKKDLSEFTGLYSLSKTLRFELVPQGKTLEHIEKNGFLIQDEHRAESYQEVKKIIDDYHKAFIEKALTGFKLKYASENKNDSLEEYYSLYMQKQRDDNLKKKFEDVQAKLRKQIAERFEKDSAFKDQFKRLFAKELIKEDLKTFVKDEKDWQLVSEFENFTTYFTGFHENRKNMYSAEEKSTAIAYRLVHDNLPKFIDNINSFEKAKTTAVAENLPQLYKDLEAYLNVKTIDDIFTLSAYSDFLTQTQIDVYNAVIGGKTLDNGTKIKGLNEYINLYNQQQTDKTKRLPKLKPLYKQILSDRNAISWLPEDFKTDKEVLESIEKCYREIHEHVFYKQKEGEHSLIELLQLLKDFDLHKIYLRNDTGLTDISQKMFGHWGVIQKAIEKRYENDFPQKNKESQEKYQERKEKYFKDFDSISIGFINECLALLGEGYDKKVDGYFAALGKEEKENKEDKETKSLFEIIADNYKKAEDLLKISYQGSSLAQDPVAVEKLKLLLDSIKAVQWFVKPLLGKGNEADKDEKFYGEFTELWKTLDQITPLYNKVRNYMTKKPYSEEKIKLNFENSTLLDGWDVNKEADNTSVILRKDGLYYLAIMDKKFNTIFKGKLPDDGTCFEKLVYKQYKAEMDIQNLIITENGVKRFTKNLDELKKKYIPEIFEIKKKQSYVQDKPKAEVKVFDERDLGKYIEYYKSAVSNYLGIPFNFRDKYNTWQDFTTHVTEEAYKLYFINVSENYINQLVEESKLYLFKIYNKDFSPHSKGTPNMHTLYWKMLFDPENLKNVVYKLNGQAEVFFRKSSINAEHTTIHPAKQALDNKNELNQKKQSIFEYDIVKDKRYTIDKFQFHVPITMNFKGIGLNNINARVNQFIKDNSDDIHIIGIDRGERHLLYLTLINPKGEIVKQFSLNEIVNEYKGNTYRTNYHDLLDKREKARLEERESWKTIETIKELKEGYISQVVHKIAELMVQYNAIVVLEDLNLGFIRGRQKVEKSVYQKFEKMLIDKLNYLVDKKKAPTEVGGTLNALQLTNKFESFKTMGKQSGFLFYVPAWNTSKMDPVTGFVNLFDTRYDNVKSAQAFFSKFDTIRYNAEKGYFEFVVNDYTRFSGKAEGTRQNWVICTYGSRIVTFRNPDKNSQWDSKEVQLTQEFINFFNHYNIDYKSSGLKEAIVSRTDKTFFYNDGKEHKNEPEGLLQLFRLTLQMRNSITGTDVDYLISPVADNNGVFFDSRHAGDKLPKDADANGAYNIARKGMWVVEQIKQAPDIKKVKLAISNKEWLQYIQ
ncbi:MAG TPA: type V CRISPR-associated protein Cas12a/Cpf1 [Bacteroidales bacterium]|nr:type V CRISPR-associated protein Cas12a/Cpf1 [Bacteroidales bacterium]